MNAPIDEVVEPTDEDLQEMGMSRDEFEFMDALIDNTVGNTFIFREENNLPEPTEDEISKVIDTLISLKKSADVFMAIMDDDALINVSEDGTVQIIGIETSEDSDDEEHECPHCVAERNNSDKKLN